MMDTMMDDDNNDNSSHLIGLRNRKSTTATTANSSIPSTISFDANAIAAATTNATTTKTKIKIRTSSVLLKFLFLLLHCVSVICFIGGFILRNHLQLNSGTEECEMTYSMRIFLPIEVEVTTTIADHNNDHNSISSSSSSSTNDYQLYKFIDRRDPRYLKFIQRKKEDIPTSVNPIRRQDRHCRSNDNIVIYVPGHWGSYDQSRSLGAHGIQLTKANDPTVFAIKKLLDSKQLHQDTADTPGINTINEFIYDVYALDFKEQGSALHGQFLIDQSNYLANVVKQLSSDCDCDRSSSSKGITIVGHSMGGIVIRLMLHNNPHFIGDLGMIQNVITLAAPHSNPLYAFDKSIYDIYQQIVVPLQPQKLQSHSQQHYQPFLLSISGGLRDEMIDPSACRVTMVVAADSDDIQQQQQQNDRSVPFVSREERFVSKEEGVSISSLSLLMSSSPLLSAMSYLGTSVWSFLSSLFEAVGGVTTNSKVRVQDAPNSLTILSTELMNNINNPNSNLDKKKQQFLRLGMDHRAIVWCHPLLTKVRSILYDLIVVTASNNNFLLDQEFDSYSQQIQLLYATYHEKYNWCILICMESSQLYHIPYLLGLYTVLTMFLMTRQSTGASTNRDTTSSSRIVPAMTTILLGGLVRCTNTNAITTDYNNRMLLITTIILGFVANSINFILIRIIKFLIQRRQPRQQHLHCHDKKNGTNNNNSINKGGMNTNLDKSHPLQTVSKAMRRSFVVVFIFGMIGIHFYYHNGVGVGDTNDNSSLVNDHFPFYLDLILYVYSIISMYITLLVWLCCFINNNNNKNNSNNNNNISNSFLLFDTQLIVYLMLLVIPISICGPLVLMVWEKNVRSSSWHTLLSLQIPILILSLLKIHLLQTNTTTTTNDDPKKKNGNDNDNNNDKKKKAVTRTKKQQQHHLIKTIRSSLIHILIYVFYHPLLSQGTGYLIPGVAQYILWIDIVATTTILTIQY